MKLEKKRAKVSGGELAYADHGEGPPVLLLHGFPTSSFIWRREAFLLAQRMRVIAVDLLGYGDSEKPDGVDLSEPAQAGYLQELLDRLGIGEIAAVGHDIGGGVAQLLALGQPASVRALALVDSVCFDQWPIYAVRELQTATEEQETPDFVEAIVRLTFDAGLAHGDRIDEAAVAEFVAQWREEPRAFFRAARGVTGRGLAGRDAELAALDIPVFILWGEEDPFLPVELAERLGEVFDGSTVALLPGCSHYVMEDAPQTVGPLIYEYLRARYLGESHAHATGPVQIFLDRPTDAELRGDGETT